MEGQEMNNSDTPLISPSNDTSYSDWLAAQSSQASLPEEPLLPPLTNITDEPMLVEEDEELNNTSQPILLPPTKKNDTDPLEEWVLELGDNEEEELSVNNNSSSLPIVESLANEHNDTESIIVISETNAPSTAPTSLSSDSISSSTSLLPSNSPSYYSTIASTLTTSSAPSSTPSSFDNTTNPPTYRRNEVLGCSPMHYKLYTNEQQLRRRNNATDSLLKLYMEEILPNTFLKLAKKHDLHSANPIVVQYINDDEELFIRKDGALYGGVVTTNDIYELIPKDDMFVPLGHSIKGDQITQIIDSMNDNEGGDDRHRVLVENYMMVEEGKDAKTNNIVGYAVEKKPAQIKDSSKYTLYTVSNNEYAVYSIMESLDIPIVTSLPPNKSEYLITNKSVRSVWIDYVKMEWPYDDNDCEGLNDQINDGDASSGGGSSGVSSTTSTSSSPNKEHGGKTVHHHDTYSDMATGKNGSSVQSPSSRGSSMASQSTSSHSNSAMSILLILTGMGAIIFFVIKARRPGHKKQSWETTISRQSELGGSSNNNDLELQVEDDKSDVAGSYGPPTGGYSSPAIGTFI